MKKFLFCLFIVINSVCLAGDDSIPTSLEQSPATDPVEYRFNGEVKDIHCLPLRLCVLALEEAEIVNAVNVGDKERWIIEPTFVGTKQFGTTQLIIKVSKPDLTTSLVVTTDRRTYLFNLKSSDEQYMPFISFSYPNSQDKKLKSYIADQKRVKANLIESSLTKERKKIQTRLTRINTNYTVMGKASWKPESVYNDGTKTYIQFPKELSGAELPVFLVMNDQDDATDSVQVNYRMLGRTMKIDYLVDNGILVTGVGSNQSRIFISRNQQKAI